MQIDLTLSLIDRPAIDTFCVLENHKDLVVIIEVFDLFAENHHVILVAVILKIGMQEGEVSHGFQPDKPELVDHRRCTGVAARVLEIMDDIGILKAAHLNVDTEHVLAGATGEFIPVDVAVKYIVKTRSLEILDAVHHIALGMAAGRLDGGAVVGKPYRYPGTGSGIGHRVIPFPAPEIIRPVTA